MPNATREDRRVVLELARKLITSGELARDEVSDALLAHVRGQAPFLLALQELERAESGLERRLENIFASGAYEYELEPQLAALLPRGMCGWLLAFPVGSVLNDGVIDTLVVDSFDAHAHAELSYHLGLEVRPRRGRLSYVLEQLGHWGLAATEWRLDLQRGGYARQQAAHRASSSAPPIPLVRRTSTPPAASAGLGLGETIASSLTQRPTVEASEAQARRRSIESPRSTRPTLPAGPSRHPSTLVPPDFEPTRRSPSSERVGGDELTAHGQVVAKPASEKTSAMSRRAPRKRERHVLSPVAGSAQSGEELPPEQAALSGRSAGRSTPDELAHKASAELERALGDLAVAESADDVSAAMARSLAPLCARVVVFSHRGKHFQSRVTSRAGSVPRRELRLKLSKGDNALTNAYQHGSYLGPATSLDRDGWCGDSNSVCAVTVRLGNKAPLVLAAGAFTDSVQVQQVAKRVAVVAADALTHILQARKR